MARHESDREDLIREATALHPRVEWQVEGEAGIVFAGLKRTGGLSLYFDQDPVYQFDDKGRLRRAFVDGLLYRSEGQTLARLRRERTETSTSLVRYDLSADELRNFLLQMRQRLESLSQQLESNRVTTLRAVPDDMPLDFRREISQAIEHSDQLAPSIR